MSSAALEHQHSELKVSYSNVNDTDGHLSPPAAQQHGGSEGRKVGGFVLASESDALRKPSRRSHGGALNRLLKHQLLINH